MPEKADTAYFLETPEGIHLRLRPAGAPVRCAAWFIDALIRIAINIGVAIIAGILGGFSSGTGSAIILLCSFILEWFYPVYFEVYRKGQTPGKKALNLAVVMDNGTSVDLQASLIRNFLRIADFLPFAYCLGMLSSLIDKRFRRLGDLAAGTLVVYCSEEIRRRKVETDDTALRLPVTLKDDERLAFFAFANRRTQISRARQQELAEILTPVHGCKGDVAISQIEAYANGLHKGH